ncbi:probable protein phosphatase 2C T23F11.1 [Artemia franciscana]|uniref:protein-serine/threonine phosphatase n=1 Tax=Artemia franciscana TaxID=6661 RepID=A0AA88I5W0_ARTSF|nr:hypothetical protein QYM36_004618 [Artemia franciscana]KAK2720805.1 hypothetical protein QYM36_004618 [Artemia franciscana]
MGQILSEPVTLKDTSACQSTQLKVGISSMQGWRNTMEDAHTHLVSLPDDESAAFFGVYDGHGGSKFAEYASTHLHKILVNLEEYKSGNYEAALKKSFLECDNDMRAVFEPTFESGGTTAVTILIKDNKLYCGNAGDSRAVASVNGKALPLSEDHKPYIEREKRRIENAGGWVDFDRVNGNLALSRALGDFSMKAKKDLPPQEQIVTGDPDVTIHEKTEDWEFVILACDGIWDVVSSQEAVDFVRNHLASGTQEPEEICEALMDHCLAPDSQLGGIGYDNMSVIIVCFLPPADTVEASYKLLVEKCGKAKSGDEKVESAE